LDIAVAGMGIATPVLPVCKRRNRASMIHGRGMNVSPLALHQLLWERAGVRERSTCE